MGEMADYYREVEDDVEIRIREDATYYLTKTNDELASLSKDSEEGIIIGIRTYWKEKGKLSDKQRWCLAKWLAIHDL
jgi:hypothetical protein